MNIAIVAAEMTPYAKAGGLADVIGALPAALYERGAAVSVVLPAYAGLTERLAAKQIGGEFQLALGAGCEPCTVWRAQAAPGVPLYLVHHQGFFGRAGIYGQNGVDYADNLSRFVWFGRAAALVLAGLVRPDVVHAHDWHACVLPIIMRADPALRQGFARTASLFTIHNLAFQGIYERSEFGLLDLDWSYFSIDCLEFFGRINLMKGAVMLSDAASTVSPTYAREVTGGPELGFGLEGVLRARGEGFVGILNGADYAEWNPATDQFIAARYTPADPAQGKQVCARDLREQLGLPAAAGRPLVGMVTRMTPQKGFDLLAEALEELMALELQLVILGSGAPEIEGLFKQAEQRHPGRLRVMLGFDNRLAHKIQAASDMFLMPSRFEPCGLTQMYALKYGTVPVVRATGGLADTVSEFDPDSGLGNGFVFRDYWAPELIGALRRGIAVFHQPALWRRLMDNGLAADFSWQRAAGEYLALFERLRGQRDGAS